MPDPASRQRVAYALDQTVAALVRGHSLSWLPSLLPTQDDRELFRDLIHRQGLSSEQIGDALEAI